MLVLATKAFAAGAALDAVAPRLADGAAVVLLCNGALSVAETLRRAALPRGVTVLAATTTHGAWLKPALLGEEGERHREEKSHGKEGETLRHVVHAGNGQTWVGPLLTGGVGRSKDPDAAGGALGIGHAGAAVRALASCGLGANLEDMQQTQRRLWLKLAANAVLNPLTALWDVRNGEVLARAEGRAIADAVCTELAALAALVVPMVAAPSQAELREFVTSCAAANEGNWSSMQQDVAAGRRTEIEQLNGWVVARCRDLGVPCAANAELTAGVLGRARAKDGRGA
jgi:2-dehydropantoate 2-reductase